MTKCVCVYAHICRHASLLPVWTHMEVRGWHERSFLVYFFTVGSLIVPEVCYYSDSGWPESLGSSYPSALVCRFSDTCAWILCGFGESKSYPHACTARILTIEPSAQPEPLTSNGCWYSLVSWACRPITSIPWSLCFHDFITVCLSLCLNFTFFVKIWVILE